jgi:hypothetical protein
VLLHLIFRDLRDRLLVLAHLQIHLHLRFLQPSILGRRVGVLRDLLHQIGRAALIEVFRDRRLVDELFGFASCENEGEREQQSEGTTHERFFLRFNLVVAR